MTPRTARPEALVERAAAQRSAVVSVLTGPALIGIAALALLAACNDDDNVATTTDPSGLTRIVFENADGEEASLFVEIADTPEERSVGLMHRESLPEDQGMLFVFENDGQHNFYMENTLIPLSIAFIKADGTIVEIEDMEPQTEELHSGPEPYRYTVEANQGWFERNGISAGSRAIIPPLTPGATP
jgi:uncharacterized membrane protein (UPF0127 family)